MTPLNVLYEAFRALPWTPLADPGSGGPPIFCDRTPAILMINTATAESRTIQQPDRAGIDLLVMLRSAGGNLTLTMTGTFDGTNSNITFSATGQWVKFRSVVTAVGTATALDSFQWRVKSYGGVTGINTALNATNVTSLSAVSATFGTVNASVLNVTTLNAQSNFGALSVTSGTIANLTAT